MTVEVPEVEMVRPMGPVARFRLLDIIDDFAQGREVFFRYVRTVGDLMSFPVVKLTLDDNVEEAVRLMKQHKIAHLPLVERDDQTGDEHFIGILSDRDLARQISRGLGTAGEADTDQAMLKSSLSNVVTRNPVCAAPTDDLFASVQKMVDKKVDCLPVMSPDKKLAGILTATDVISVFLKINLLQRLTGMPERRKARLIDLHGSRRAPDSKLLISTHFNHVRDVMTGGLQTAEPSMSIATAMRVMKEGRFRHLPVVEKKQGLVGIVSDRDILHALPPLGSSPPSADKEPGWRDKLFGVEGEPAVLKTEVRSIMTGTSKLITTTPEGLMVDAINTMLINEASAVLVVSEDDVSQLKGVITKSDLMRAVAVLGQMMSFMGK